MDSSFDNERAFRELVSRMEKLDKKIDKLLTLNTKIAKVLHLLPVTEKEEREFQLRQRENANIVKKVSEELAEMAPKKEEFDYTLPQLVNMEPNPFADILGDDYNPRKE